LSFVVYPTVVGLEADGVHALDVGVGLQVGLQGGREVGLDFLGRSIRNANSFTTTLYEREKEIVKFRLHNFTFILLAKILSILNL
jgi:hypothetical protein